MKTLNFTSRPYIILPSQTKTQTLFSCGRSFTRVKNKHMLKFSTSHPCKVKFYFRSGFTWPLMCPGLLVI